MPLYNYLCDSCNEEYDIIHSMKDCDVPQLCKVCQTTMHRVPCAPAVLFESSDLWTEPRYISQLEYTPEQRIDMGRKPTARSREAYCSSRRELLEKVAQREMKVVSGGGVKPNV